MLVVTSAAPDEGKTFVTSQLALALAAAHERVALIDGDLRRPRLHSVFDKPRQPGLSDVLLGARTATDVLIATGHPGLSLMPAGAGQSAAGELLPRQTFKNLIAELRLTFDWVLIDSPPVMAAADAGVLAREASAVVFVTCADQTTLESADAALADLAAVDAPVLGAVLNRAPITREAFYYSRYYRADYAAYLSDAEPARAGDLLGRP